ncbi:hypothetical protein [Terasakiella pusilla]|uniref:hypothetical protein n=1 Tax=Terasakiella pusilla TaxID=64973 RepID=UPI003AA88CDC
MGKKLEEKVTKNRFTMGIGFALFCSAIWTVCGLGLIWYRANEIIHKDNFFEINELGDFLAGWFSPLAFVWFVGTVFIQKEQLSKQSKEISLNTKALQAQIDEMKETVKHGQFKLVSDQVEKFERETFLVKYAKYEEVARRIVMLLNSLCRKDEEFARRVFSLVERDFDLKDIAVKLHMNISDLPMAVYFVIEKVSEIEGVIFKISDGMNNPWGVEGAHVGDAENAGLRHEYNQFMRFSTEVDHFVTTLKSMTDDQVVALYFSTSAFGEKYRNLQQAKVLGFLTG